MTKKGTQKKAKQPKKPDHPAKKYLDDLGQPYIVIFFGSESIIAAKQKDPDQVFYNVTDSAFQSKIVELTQHIMTPPQLREQPGKEVKE